MKPQGSRIITFVLIGVLFLCASSVYAKTGKKSYKNENTSHLQSKTISDLTKAIEINPNDAEAYTGRGTIYANQNNFTQAISDFTKAIEINPNLAGAYYSRSNSYYMEKEYDKAWADLHKTEELGYTVEPKVLAALKKASGRDK